MFSLQGAARYKFFMSPALPCRLFSTAIVEAMQTPSLQATDAYFIDEGALVMRPPKNHARFVGISIQLDGK